MNIGSLYQVKKHSWLLFPTKETNVHAHRHVVDYTCVYDDNENAAWWAARYSTKYNCNVTWFSPDSFVVCLEEDGMLKKLLTSKGLIGWTRFGEDESYNESFEEVKP